MTIAKGQAWGHPGALAPDGIVARSDAEAAATIASIRATGELPTIGLLAGDLCRTLGGRGDTARLYSPDAMTFPIDVGLVTVGETELSFVAHVVIRSRLWRRSTVVMNAPWLGGWNPAPRAHPDDGVLDVLDAGLGFGDLWRVRSRLALGAHLPHPRIAQRRTTALDVEVARGMQLWIDGEQHDARGPVRIGVAPDAARVVV